MRNDSDTEAAAAPPNESREFIHECNNLLAGILNATALMRRARSEEDREEAIALIEDAVARAQKKIQHVPDLLARAVGSLARESMVSDDEAETVPTALGEGPVESTEAHTVLVAEDDDMNRQLLRKLLESTGKWIVIEAENGLQAVERYRNGPTDLVLLDMAMPGLGGAEVLERLRVVNSRVRVVFLSGYVDPHSPLLRERNVVGYLQKPVEA
ncbi:MAG: response regulator, partial [Chrysiogenetes bacterium]|nr:response regulator [Chrysiogenetes bacterium]